MSRLIDADKLMEARKQAISVYENANVFTPTAIREGLKPLLDLIVDAPTITPDDLRPRGRWEPILDGVWNLPNPVLSGWRCSECGRTENNKEPYCNCGAKMEGEN